MTSVRITSYCPFNVPSRMGAFVRCSLLSKMFIKLYCILIQWRHRIQSKWLNVIHTCFICATSVKHVVFMNSHLQLDEILSICSFELNQSSSMLAGIIEWFVFIIYLGILSLKQTNGKSTRRLTLGILQFVANDYDIHTWTHSIFRLQKQNQYETVTDLITFATQSIFNWFNEIGCSLSVNVFSISFSAWTEEFQSKFVIARVAAFLFPNR